MGKTNVIKEYFEAILVAVVLAFFIRGFIVQAYQIPSGSMLDTLLIGDRLLVNKFIYGIKIPFTDVTIVDISDPKVNDIIVFASPEHNGSIDYIKRIVGAPGDKLEMRNKVLFRNDKPVEEPYARYADSAHDSSRDNFGPITIPADSYFAMGDNRDNSRDSRMWGFVPRANIHGKAWRIFWSWGGKEGDAGTSPYPATGPRWGRVGSLIQ